MLKATLALTIILQVLNSTISIPRGKSVDVHLQFTIPFISLHGISNLPHMLIDNQPALQIRMAVHNASSSVCDGLEKKACDTDISAYKFNESKRYNTDMWKEIHKIKVNNEDDGDVKPKIDKHITLRFKTGPTYGLGSKIFEEIGLSDVQAIFPTGTIVEIKLVSWPYRNDWQLNINIYPSPSDVGLSSGLCGILDGNYKNDFTWNNPEKTVENPDHYHQWRRPHPDGFSKSWRVKNGDINLFDNSVYGSLKSITTVFDRVCRCNKNNKVINCSYGNYKDCKFAVGKRHYCIVNHHIQSRRKRDLHHLKSIKLSEPPMDSVIPKNHRKRETNIYLMSYEEAMSICVEAFQASDSYLMCQEHVSGLGNTSLVNCIADLMMTEDLNITKIHVEAALVQCSTFVVLNSTFQEVKPDITYRIKSICENNCSGNGICNSGNCTCNSGYAGSDCSVDLTGPPTITHISDFGFCDKTSEACDEITLYGRYFLENMDTTCYLKRKTVGEDGSVLSETNLEISLQERTLFEGYCPLYYNADYHWVTEFRFNISNDGSQFTDSYNVYTYQSLCQEIKNDTGNITFTFKDGYCYINNTCVADGDSNPDNLCDVCITGKNKYQWTYNTGHCFIDGNCFPGGAINGTNPCSVCNPSLNITAWSSNPGFCFIDGICYFDDQTNPSNNCDICLSQISHSTWSFNERVDMSINNIKISFHNVSWNTTIEKEGPTTRTVHNPYVNLKCSFVSSSSDNLLFYKVEWYVNDHTFVKSDLVGGSSVRHALLSLKALKSGIQVQTRHEKCHDSYPFPQCTCAVSVKSGRDLFMIDVCENNNFVDFLRCQDNVIKVYKEEDKLFKILLPMGTIVIASLVEWPVEGSWQIDIDIYPSLSDVNNTVGLCGTLDGNGGNDFTHRNGHKDSSSLEYPDDFSRSWMVQSNENLLNGAPSDLPSVPFSLDRICTCSANGDQCFYNAFSECSKTTGKQYYCGQTNLLQASRKRRGVHLSKNSVWSRQKRQESIYVTSEARAGNVCKTAFNRSESFEKCEEYVSDMTNVSLSNCIMDVRLTGDENIPSIHIEDALKQCVRLIVFNTTLKTQQPDITNQIQSLCSNNCSGHGICKEGHCLCDSDFGGSDCSFDVRAPPTILRTSPNETCDMSSSNCSEVLLEGRYFLENINITCFITRQLVNHDNNAVDITDSEQPLDDRTLFHGACPLPKDSISTWITKFTLKISYDGKSFSRAFPIYIYKSECQQKSYVDGFGQFTLKAGYCYIDSKCVQKDVSKLGHSCEVCNPSSQKYDWSLHQDCVSTTSPPQTTKSPISTPAFIITVSIVSAVFVGTLVVIILAWRCRSSSKRHYKDDDSTKDINVAKWRKYFDEGDKLHNFYIPRGRRNNEQEYYTNSENTYRY
ncbi:uncharacterized protein LOC134271468 [Saccostrea cucullata]|uniref:uncharacterized protein LOC134271468 n=1 Tax=Saccostrea cuccullata TaxID=36930 RepID=UPI002ED3DFC6